MNQKIGIVGYGYWGPNLLRNFFETDGCEVVYVCDKDIDRLREVKKRYPSIVTTTNFEEVIASKEISAVVIATPTKFHYPMASMALVAGKDVLVEKPFTLTLKEAKSLSKIAQKHQRVMMVDHTFLFNEAVLQVKKIVESGKIGKILYIDSTRANLGLFQDDINVIFDLATHDFSIIQFLLKQKPVKIQAFARSHISKQEDVASMVLHYSNGVFANVHVSWLSPLKVRRMLIVGTKKMIVYDDTEPSEKIKIFDKGVALEKGLTKKLELAKISYRSGDVWLPNIKGIEALGTLAKEFIKALKKRKNYKSGPDSAVLVMDILEKATTAARQGKILSF